MQATFQILFWASVALIFYSYILYPALLILIAKNKKENQVTYSDKEELPDVSILIAAYNEDRIISEKLKSILSGNYPHRNIEILIGSDASTDRTDEMVMAFQEKHPNVILKKYEKRTGKSAILNDLKKMSRSAIIILTDANVLFGDDTIYQMVKHFRNEEIGLVGANIINRGLMKEGISFQEMAYIQRENNIKYLEGVVWGSMAGAFGACYAIRKELLPEIPSNFLMEDFYITMNVLKNRKKAMNDLNALCYEDVSDELWEEFRRKMRISAGNFQNLAAYYPILLRFYTGAGFSFLSHKVIRWFGPVLLLTAFFSSGLSGFLYPPIWSEQSYGLRIPSEGNQGGLSHFYQWIFFIQCGLFMLPLLDKLLAIVNIHFSILRFITHFYLMNLALLMGMFWFFTGIQSGVWKPTKRNI